MESVRIHQPVGADGVLHLEIPVGVADQDLEVMVIYQPAAFKIETAEAGESSILSTAKLKSIEQVQSIVRKYVPEGQSLVEELLEDRRVEADGE